MSSPDPAERDRAKRDAARAALAELPEGGIVGLGSGSTASLFLEELGALIKSGRRFLGVPTSEASRSQALSLGIELANDEGPWDIAVTVDGADEVDDALTLIKGGGAAHTREKIVNFASRRNVIVVDATKLSRRVGERWPIPLEILPFGHLQTLHRLRAFGRPVLRERAGTNVRTDSGNLVCDLAVGPVEDPGALDRALHAVPGVVETGLFVGRADVVLVAGADGVRRLSRPPP